MNDSCALHAAAFYGFPQITRRLLQKNFNANVNNLTGRYEYILKPCQRSLLLHEWLMLLFRDFNLHLSNFSCLRSFARVTPIQLAKEQGHDSVVQELLAHGATDV